MKTNLDVAHQFDLNAWEVYYDDTVSSGEVVCIVSWQERNYELIAVYRRASIGLRFRDLQHPSIVLTELDAMKPAEMWRPSASDDAETLTTRFEQAVKTNNWGRHFQLDRKLQILPDGPVSSHADAYICLRPDGSGCWILPDCDDNPVDLMKSALFRHDLSARQLLELSNDTLVAWIGEQVARGDECDLAYAYRLMRSPEGEVAIKTCRFVRGDALTWKRITRAIVWANWFWPDEITHFQWRIRVARQSFPLTPYAEGPGAFWILNGDTNVHYDDEDLPAQSGLREQLLKAHLFFDPTLDSDFCAQHAELGAMAGTYGGVQCIIAVSKPSFHQRLEAAIMLREWEAAESASF